MTHSSDNLIVSRFDIALRQPFADAFQHDLIPKREPTLAFWDGSFAGIDRLTLAGALRI
jgi:hypothetical protein